MKTYALGYMMNEYYVYDAWFFPKGRVWAWTAEAALRVAKRDFPFVIAPIVERAEHFPYEEN